MNPSRFSFDFSASFWKRLLFLFGCPLTVQATMYPGSRLVLRLAGAVVSTEASVEDRCPIADRETNDEFYCTRLPGHDGPCAAVPYRGVVRNRGSVGA